MSDETHAHFYDSLAMDNHGAIHEEIADFIAATARIAEKLYYANICTLVQLASFYVI